MLFRYHKIEQSGYSDEADEDRKCQRLSEEQTTNAHTTNKHRRIISVVGVALLLSLMMNVAQYSSANRLESWFKRPLSEKAAITKELDIKWKRFFWNTEYSPKGQSHTSSDKLWDQILPSHGFVAIDRQQAAEDGWPASMWLPDDKTKGVYLLEAYHQLHCLRILRKTFWEAVDGRPYTYHPSSHVEHCFDALRQATICNADNTPLYTFGNWTAGDGQMHKCRSWEQLRDYATANTACYRDSVKPILLGDHFGYCDDGDDGVLLSQE